MVGFAPLVILIRYCLKYITLDIFGGMVVFVTVLTGVLGNGIKLLYKIEYRVARYLESRRLSALSLGGARAIEDA